MTTVLVDNYDSFTWNIHTYLSVLGANVLVVRNDAITIKELAELRPRNIVLSPGPGHPSTDAGICNDIITEFAGKIPILGVCLGEQCIYHVYGGSVTPTGEWVHGKTSEIEHDGRGCLADIPQRKSSRVFDKRNALY